MKLLSLLRKNVFLTVVILFASMSFSVVSSFAQDAPEEVARTLIAAEDSNNVDAAMATFAEDAVVTLPTGVFDTPDAIRGWQQELADGHFRVEPVNLEVDGNTVSWTGDISLDTFRNLGISSMGGMWSLVIEDGLVETFDFNFTPEAFTELQAGITAATLIGAEDSNDVDGAVAAFAEDAVVTLPTGVFDTPDAIRGWQQELADGNFHIEPVGVAVHGNTVTWTGDIYLDAFRNMGIAAMGGIWSLVIEDGKIETFDFTFTPEAFAALAAAQPA
ncbi:MAG: nuclear transport factor 2 family protein [Chloroflexota bacterium]